jgi:hypothetical protein
MLKKNIDIQIVRRVFNIALSVPIVFPVFSQKAVVIPPNGKINAALFYQQDGASGNWYLKVNSKLIR